MKIEVWVQTRSSQSRVANIIDIDDEDLEGLGATDREEIITEIAQGESYNLYEWGYNELK